MTQAAAQAPHGDVANALKFRRLANLFVWLRRTERPDQDDAAEERKRTHVAHLNRYIVVAGAI